MSSMPGTGITFDLLGNPGGLERVLSDGLSRIQRFAADVSRIKATVDVGVRGGGSAPGAGTLAGIGREAGSFFDSRFSSSGPGGYGGGFSGAVASRAQLAAGGAAGGGAAASLARVGGALAAVDVGIEALGVTTRLMAAGADAAKGNTRDAVAKIADLGDEIQKLPLIRHIAKPLAQALGFVTEINRDIAKARADTEKNDAKSDRMEAQNRAARANNATFTAVTKEEAARLAKEGKSQPEQELADVRRQIADLEKQRKANANAPGFDDTSAGEAIAKLRQRETSLVSDAAAERERRERQHQEQLTAIMAKGQADRLRAEGLTQAAERAELAEKQRAERQGILDDLIGKTPGEQRRIRERLQAVTASQAAEGAAFARKVADEEKPGGPQPDDDTAANFARAAGEASVARERAREAVLRRRRDEQFEARQADLGVRGLDARARVEAARHRAEAALAETEDPETRRAIQQRQAAELRAVLRDVDRPTLGAVVAGPTRTAFGRGGPGVGDAGEGTREIDKTLRGDIKNLLRQIADNTKSAVAVTS